MVSILLFARELHSCHQTGKVLCHPQKIISLILRSFQLCISGIKLGPEWTLVEPHTLYLHIRI